MALASAAEQGGYSSSLSSGLRPSAYRRIDRHNEPARNPAFHSPKPHKHPWTLPVAKGCDILSIRRDDTHNPRRR